jgi:hypothetical protein
MTGLPMRDWADDVLLREWLALLPTRERRYGREMGRDDSAGVLAPPPVLFLASWTLAHVLHRIVSLEVSRHHRDSRRVVGGALIGAGVSSP